MPGRAGFSNSCANNDPSKGVRTVHFSPRMPLHGGVVLRIFAALSGAICCRRSMLSMMHCTSLLMGRRQHRSCLWHVEASPSDSVANDHGCHCIHRIITCGRKWPLWHPLKSGTWLRKHSCSAPLQHVVLVKKILAAMCVEVSPRVPGSPGTVGKTRRGHGNNW